MLICDTQVVDEMGSRVRKFFTSSENVSKYIDKHHAIYLLPDIYTCRSLLLSVNTIVELRAPYYVTCGKLTPLCMLMCSVHFIYVVPLVSQSIWDFPKMMLKLNLM